MTLVLVDTSIWVDHFRKSNLRLKSLLEEDRVLIHPFIIGELACGSLANRDEILDLLQLLPHSQEASFSEVLKFIRIKKTHGKGVGFVDVNLLASSLLTHCNLWTADKRLQALAVDLKIHFES